MPDQLDAPVKAEKAAPVVPDHDVIRNNLERVLERGEKLEDMIDKGGVILPDVPFRFRKLPRRLPCPMRRLLGFCVCCSCRS